MSDSEIRSLKLALLLAERLLKQINDEIDTANLPRSVVLTRLISGLVDAAKATGVSETSIRKLIRASINNSRVRGKSDDVFDMVAAKGDVSQLVREMFEGREGTIEDYHLTEIQWTVHDYVAKCSDKYAEPSAGWDEIREELHEHAVYAAQYD